MLKNILKIITLTFLFIVIVSIPPQTEAKVFRLPIEVDFGLTPITFNLSEDGKLISSSFKFYNQLEHTIINATIRLSLLENASEDKIIDATNFQLIIPSDSNYNHAIYFNRTNNLPFYRWKYDVLKVD